MEKTAFNKIFGEFVREKRIHLKLSQSNLGDRMGLDYQYISRVERGLISPTLFWIIGLSNAFELPLELFIREFVEFSGINTLSIKVWFQVPDNKQSWHLSTGLFTFGATAWSHSDFCDPLRSGSGVQILWKRLMPSIEPQLLCSCWIFPFKLLFKINFNRFKRKNPALSCRVLFVIRSGFEPEAFALEGRCSIQLS